MPFATWNTAALHNPSFQVYHPGSDVGGKWQQCEEGLRSKRMQLMNPAASQGNVIFGSRTANLFDERTFVMVMDFCYNSVVLIWNLRLPEC